MVLVLCSVAAGVEEAFERHGMVVWFFFNAPTGRPAFLYVG